MPGKQQQDQECRSDSLPWPRGAIGKYLLWPKSNETNSRGLESSFFIFRQFVRYELPADGPLRDTLKGLDVHKSSVTTAVWGNKAEPLFVIPISNASDVA